MPSPESARSQDTLGLFRENMGLVRIAERLHVTLRHKFPRWVLAVLDTLPEASLIDTFQWVPTLEPRSGARFLSLRRFFRTPDEDGTPLPDAFIGYIVYDGFRGFVGTALDGGTEHVAEPRPDPAVLGEHLHRFRSQGFMDFCLRSLRTEEHPTARS